MSSEDFSGGPVLKDYALLMRGAKVQSLVGELTSHVPAMKSGQK